MKAPTPPPEINFAGQSENERVLLLLRRHPLVLSPRLLSVVLIAWIPWVVYVMGPGFGSAFSALFLLTSLGGLSYLFVVWSDWYNSLYVVTNQRVIVTQQRNLWRREVREVPLAKIQEVRHDQQGLFRILLKVGHLVVRTASTELRLEDVGEPYEIEQQIAALIHRPHQPRRRITAM